MDGKHDLTTRRGVLMALASGEKLCFLNSKEFVYMDEWGTVRNKDDIKLNGVALGTLLAKPKALKIYEEPKPKRKLYQWVIKESHNVYHSTYYYYTDVEVNEKYGDKVFARLDHSMVEVE